MILLFVLGMLSCCIKSLRAQKMSNLPIAQLTLTSSDGLVVTLSAFAQHKATVLILLSPECPISQQCTKAINELWLQNNKSNIAFYGVVPGAFYDTISVNAFKETYHIPFPILTDKNYALTKELKAHITPEVFVLSGDYAIVYSGAIDNAYVAPGRKRAVVSAHYLADALSALMHDKPITTQKTKAIGCLIEIKDADQR